MSLETAGVCLLEHGIRICLTRLLYILRFYSEQGAASVHFFLYAWKSSIHFAMAHMISVMFNGDDALRLPMLPSFRCRNSEQYI